MRLPRLIQPARQAHGLDRVRFALPVEATTTLHRSLAAAAIAATALAGVGITVATKLPADAGGNALVQMLETACCKVAEWVC